MGNLGEIPVADLSNSINLFYTGCAPLSKGGGDMTWPNKRRRIRWRERLSYYTAFKPKTKTWIISSLFRDGMLARFSCSSGGGARFTGQWRRELRRRRRRRRKIKNEQDRWSEGWRERIMRRREGVGEGSVRQWQLSTHDNSGSCSSKEN